MSRVLGWVRPGLSLALMLPVLSSSFYSSARMKANGGLPRRPEPAVFTVAAPSPGPRRASGSDGAVIGASTLVTGDKGRSPAGVHMPARRPGRGAAISWEDMTWSGVTARTEGLPTGLPEHSGWPGGGGCPRRVVPLVSDGVNTPLLLSGPLEPQDVKAKLKEQALKGQSSPQHPPPDAIFGAPLHHPTPGWTQAGSLSTGSRAGRGLDP
ncbi:hypothetical protein SUZIE_172010 [Sciurus carolinensis]|uniref:Uncharacterized protein n=1 Tax=Sciurus carolinensis TaxID=30640 RepID=A0AA41N3R9_SCICA|nr:hypothetical protein [Sciurus carolinensis]